MQSIIDILHKFPGGPYKFKISRRVFKFQEISRSCRHPAYAFSPNYNQCNINFITIRTMVVTIWYLCTIYAVFT